MSAILEAIKSRHSVRQYEDKPIEDGIVKQLNDEIDTCNKEGGLHFQLVTNEPRAFDCMLAKYGRFVCVKNYIVLAAKKDLDESVGYFGERIVLLAQSLGLNSCWVGMSYSTQPDFMKVEADEKIYGLIAMGYGANQGVQHSMRPMENFVKASIPLPDWFKSGMEAALLAPTAIHQQKFTFELVDDHTVKATTRFALMGYSYTQVDLGIVKYHFEIAAGKDNFQWA